MRIAIDTNRYCDFCAGDGAAVERFATAESIYLPFVTLAELRAGFLSGTLTRRNEATLQHFLNRPRIRVLYPTESTTHHYARLYAQLRSQGTPIPTNDLWIAALTMEHDLLLYSRDAHFDYLPQLPRLS